MLEAADVAIAGLDGVFPGAASLEELWQNLLRDESGIRPVGTDRWTPADASDGPDLAGLMPDPAGFDSAFFGISPTEAASMDPQQRLALESAWRAVEDGGVAPQSLAGRRVGVFVGVMGNEWGQLTLTDPETMTPQLGTGNGYCMIANRLSYVLGLTGPSQAVDSACSSSLVALHQARRAIQSGDCDEAIVVGVNVIMTPVMGRFYEIAGLGAGDGECKPFSSRADGIVRGEAVVAAYLRPLPSDSDGFALPRVRAVIRGSSVGHGGRSNGLTAPNRRAQADVIGRALADGGVLPDSIHAVECHGTGTILGDMIETNALGDVFGGERTEPVLIGSIKGNIGHVEGAAGLAGVARAVLALEHRLLPPSRHAATANPALRLESKALRLPYTATRLRGSVARIGVSSFGLGGTNAHVVLESVRRRREPPVAARPQDERHPLVAALGGPDGEAVRRNAAAVARVLATPGSPSAEAVCRTLRRTRSQGACRVAVVGTDPTSLSTALGEVARGGSPVAAAWSTRRTGRSRATVGWVFAGQGTEHPGMTRALAASSPEYARHLEEMAQGLLPGLHARLQGGDDGWLADPHAVQAAVVAHELAAALTLQGWGLCPDWVAGHSLGEIPAAVVSGAMDLESAGLLLRARGAATAAMDPRGGMLAVALEDVGEHLAAMPEVSLAVRNRADRVVVAGAREDLEALSRRLRDAGVASKMLDSARAFHSPHVEPVLDDFAAAVSALPPGEAPSVPFFSSRLGRFLSAEDRLDASHWVRHLREPVLFSALATAAPETDLVLEFGPRPVLGGALGTGRLRDAIVLPATPEGTREDHLLKLLAQVVADAGSVPWTDPGETVPVPGYAFDHTNRYWRTAVRGHQGRTDDVPLPGGSFSGQTVQETGEADVALSPSLLEWVLAAIVRISGHPPERVRPTSSLADDLYFDSVMVVQLAAAAEAEFGVSLDLRSLADAARTPADIASLLKQGEGVAAETSGTSSDHDQEESTS